MAPDTFEGDYHGNQEKSKGIIGLLEVIESDFARTIQTVNDEEIAAQDEFNAFKDMTEADIADKNEAKKAREDRRDEIKEELASQCIRGEETYEERVAKRTKEIEALKEAH